MARSDRLHTHSKITMTSYSARFDSVGVAFSVPFSLANVAEVEYFVARKDELHRMHEELSYRDDGRSVLIHGLGGMGKTQLAVAYAKQHRTDYSAIFWINARDETTLKHSYMRAAKRITNQHPTAIRISKGVESGDVDEAVLAVNQWLDQSKNDRWLLMIITTTRRLDRARIAHRKNSQIHQPSHMAKM